MTEVRTTRTIPASPDRVYRAWLDPELLERWMTAGNRNVTRVEVDERIGGRHSVWHADSTGDVGGFESELLELEPGRRIVFLWRFVGPGRAYDPTHDSRLTVTLAEASGNSTELTLLHERLEAFATAMPEVAAMVETGWATALDNLVALEVEEPAAAR